MHIPNPLEWYEHCVQAEGKSVKEHSVVLRLVGLRANLENP